MIQYCVVNFRFIKITKKHCFYQDDIGKLRGILNIQIKIKNVNTDRCIDQYTRNTVGTTGCRKTFSVLWLPLAPITTNGKFSNCTIGRTQNGAMFCWH